MMMKPNTMAIGALITVVLAMSIGFLSQPTHEIETKDGMMPLMPTYDLNGVGSDATLSNVQAAIGLNYPAYLPSGTSSPQVKLREDNSLAALIYTNPNLKRIIGYQQDVQIVILAERDGTSFETFRTTESKPTVTITEDGKERTVGVPVKTVGLNRSRVVSVAGNPGYGYDPLDVPEWHDSGRVQWWTKEGIHYEILADIPLQELLKIAESMQHV
ncbi:MAG: DUF4367 domain-containing protein [Thaumarchaeota archaeon]|nr:DUF4367 domain-containing protein [Nitrososphaerota archaeon]